ncbi:MAG: BtrH N-terminal domain-containing protein [Sarcina sp.]
MKKITKLKDRRSYNCYSGSVCYLLECNDLVLSEHVSFGLSRGLNFELKLDNKITFFAVRELHCLTEYILKLGVQVIENIEGNYESLLNNLKKEIDKDKPFIVAYDGFYIPFTQIFKTKHEKRICLVIGYDDENIYLSDFVYGAYEFPISNKQFIQAVTEGSGNCENLKWYNVTFPQNLNQLIKESEIKDAILEVSNYFLQNEKMNKTSMIGVSGIREFANKLDVIIKDKKSGDINWTDFSEDIKQLCILLNHYSDFLDYLINEKKITADIKKIQESSKLIREAAKVWKIVCNLFFRMGLTGIVKDTNRIKDNVIKVADLLENAFRVLKYELEDER